MASWEELGSRQACTWTCLYHVRRLDPLTSPQGLRGFVSKNRNSSDHLPRPQDGNALCRVCSRCLISLTQNSYHQYCFSLASLPLPRELASFHRGPLGQDSSFSLYLPLPDPVSVETQDSHGVEMTVTSTGLIVLLGQHQCKH